MPRSPIATMIRSHASAPSSSPFSRIASTISRARAVASSPWRWAERWGIDLSDDATRAPLRSPRRENNSFHFSLRNLLREVSDEQAGDHANQDRDRTGHGEGGGDRPSQRGCGARRARGRAAGGSSRESSVA